jgi:hypothetical protein
MENLNDLKVIELKEMCRKLGLSVGGTKNELKLRIKKHFKTQSQNLNEKTNENKIVISDRQTPSGKSKILITINEASKKRKREEEEEEEKKEEVENTENHTNYNVEEDSRIEIHEMAHHISINQTAEIEEPKPKKRRGNGLTYLPMMNENNEIIDYKEYSTAENIILNENDWLKGIREN